MKEETAPKQETMAKLEAEVKQCSGCRGDCSVYVLTGIPHTHTHISERRVRRESG